MTAILEIAKVGTDEHTVEIRTEGPDILYEITVQAEDVENIGMEPEEWSGRRVEDGKVIFTGVAGPPADSVRATNISMARCRVREGSDVPAFNAVYVDKTAKEPKRETLATMQKDYTWYVSPWANPMVKAGVGVVGVTVATGIIGRWLDWW